MTSNAWMVESLILGAGGVAAAGLAGLILTGWLLDRRAEGQHAPRHALEPLPPAPVEVIRIADQPTAEHRALQAPLPEPERTEEEPDEVPVEHEGATPDWSPTAELALVPVRPLDPVEAELVDEDEAFSRELDRVLGPILDELRRVGHEDCPTAEWSLEQFRAMRPAGAR